MKKSLFTTALLLAVVCFQIRAQVFETNITPVEGEADQTILDQASASFTGTSPYLTLKTYKLKGLVGKGTVDLYLFNSVPAFSIKRTDSLNVLAEDVLNQLGGLLNFSLSKVGYFGNGGDQINKDIKGGQVDFRLGGKALDSRNRDFDANFIVPVFQSTFDVRYLIPLVAPQTKKQSSDNLKKAISGNLSFRVYGGFMQIFNTTIYDQYYTDVRGNPPTHSLFTGGAEINLFISNQFYISGGVYPFQPGNYT